MFVRNSSNNIAGGNGVGSGSGVGIRRSRRSRTAVGFNTTATADNDDEENVDINDINELLLLKSEDDEDVLFSIIRHTLKQFIIQTFPMIKKITHGCCSTKLC